MTVSPTAAETYFGKMCVHVYVYTSCHRLVVYLVSMHVAYIAQCTNCIIQLIGMNHALQQRL